MQHYIGTKAITARLMSRQSYNDYRGWVLPDNENGADEGYLVEYLDGGQSNHPDHDGYVSWSPKEQFENAYQASGSMSFGHALVALKSGQRVARAGWNGKGMWLVLVPGSADIECREGSPYHNAGFTRGDILPHIDMYTASGQMLPGWLASQSDMLADDWEIV